MLSDNKDEETMTTGMLNVFVAGITMITLLRHTNAYGGAYPKALLRSQVPRLTENLAKQMSSKSVQTGVIGYILLDELVTVLKGDPETAYIRIGKASILKAVPDVASLLRKSNRPLKVASLHFLDAAIRRIDVVKQEVLPSVFKLVRSPLINGQALDSLLALFAAIVRINDKEFTALVSSLVEPATAPTPEGTSSGQHTPTHQQDSVRMQLGSVIQSTSNSAGFTSSRFSRTPSPSRAGAHSPPPHTSGGSGYSSGRLSPVSSAGFVPNTQPAFGQSQGFHDHTVSQVASSVNQQQQHPQQQQAKHLSQSINIASFTSARNASHSAPDAPGRLEGLSRSNSGGGPWQAQFSPHPEQTPHSIPQALLLGSTDYAPTYYGPSGQDPAFGAYTPTSATFTPNHHHQQQQQQHRFSRHMSFTGPPMVAPQPTRQRVLHSQPPTPGFHPQRQHQPMIPFQQQHQQQQQQQHHHQSQHQYQQHQHFQPTYPPQPLTPSTPHFNENFGHSHVPMSRSESEGSQASVLKLPPGYFPVYNGSEWVMISHAAAAVAGIPPPNPQNNPPYPINGPANGFRGSFAPTPRLDELAPSHSDSPPANITSHHGSESGHVSVALSRTNSESRHGSVPPQSGFSRASSPADPRTANKSPASSSPSRQSVQQESSSAVQENLDFLELLQKYDYLNAWTRQGKSMTPSEAGSPVDGTTTPKKQEPFEKSLVLNEITTWIEEHKDYLLREQPDLFVPAQIDFGNINPKAEPVRKMIRVENRGSRIMQIQALKIIPNHYDQLVCHNQDVIYAHPANGTEPMFGIIDMTLTTGANLGVFSSWLLILVNESSLIGRKITWHVTNNTQADREMDPYAKSYTPQWLRNLNVAKPRMIITGDPVDTIDFQQYMKSVGHPCYKKHNGKFSLEPPVVESLEMILPGQITVDLSADTYASRLLPLLRVEQHLVDEDVSTYNLFMVEIKLHDASSNYFQIQVRGLAEKCPLLLRGDTIIVRQVTNGVFSGIEYKTFVYGTNLRTNSVYVHLPIGALSTLVNERWNIQFKVSNNRIREMYRAVSGVQEFIGYHPRNPSMEAESDQVYSPRSFVFPAIQDAKPKIKLPKLTLEFVDPTLNWEQKAAVESSVRNDYGTFALSGSIFLADEHCGFGGGITL
ncbi:MAG: hypothetical protein J3Q66DRAFT_400082 [Benniella sp.]|nr:MAG: hypothetical protein J3Q66DRAFT_400082 [Benniella sp.]